MTTCKFSLGNTYCDEEATCYVMRHIGEETWTIETTPKPVETLNVFAITNPVLDAFGRPQWDTKGQPLREPVLHECDFCDAHGVAVCFQRNAMVVADA